MRDIEVDNIKLDVSKLVFCRIYIGWLFRGAVKISLPLQDQHVSILSQPLLEGNFESWAWFRVSHGGHGAESISHEFEKRLIMVG